MRRRKEAEEDDQEEIDPEYKQVASYVLSKVDQKSQESVAHVLSSSKARETYDILKREDIPSQTIRKIMLQGIGHLSRGKSISPGAYATAIAQELTNDERYADAALEMYEEGVISENQYESVTSEIREHSGKNIRRLSYLENIARAATWFAITAGIILMMFSATSITGAVIGAPGYSSAIFIIGFIIFVLGLLTQKRKN